MMQDSEQSAIPIFLLKTKSLPQDGYEEYFRGVEEGLVKTEPVFVPVLEHRFDEGNLAVVRELLGDKQFGAQRYGGLIFTSQRAVEAFGRLVDERRGKCFLSIVESGTRMSLIARV